ncbi:ScbA/BarX family gamma-butyrolactone biosynthesis protein [Agromyces sp. NPDC058136]|uniref:ScbA/BarX family gamma-butyrolactone biosynthesis protein n=1 Tax=Agromyces sp. NPDC058136 TaxID=3346354 RepID=UPI0036DAE3A2
MTSVRSGELANFAGPGPGMCSDERRGPAKTCLARFCRAAMRCACGRRTAASQLPLSSIIKPVARHANLRGGAGGGFPNPNKMELPVPSFERPVERALVHRQSTSEVWPTDFEALGQGRYQVSLQWPRSHAFYTTTPPDSAVLAETIRQVTILTCHLGHSVPLDSRFLMTGLGFELRSDEGCRGEWNALEVTALVEASDIRRTARGELRSARMNIEISGPDGRVIAVGHGDALLAGSVAYRRMRGPNANATPPRRTAEPVEPERVGRSRASDVTVVETIAGLEIQIDHSHPVFFEHSLDHVPGVALIEACKQVACLFLGNPSADLQRFEARFHRVIEFNTPATITVASDAVGVRFAVLQGGTVAMDASAGVSVSGEVAVLP